MKNLIQVLSIILILLFSSVAIAQVTQGQINQAIDTGLSWLVGKQEQDGSWFDVYQQNSALPAVQITEQIEEFADVIE